MIAINAAATIITGTPSIYLENNEQSPAFVPAANIKMTQKPARRARVGEGRTCPTAMSNTPFGGNPIQHFKTK